MFLNKEITSKLESQVEWNDTRIQDVNSHVLTGEDTVDIMGILMDAGVFDMNPEMTSKVSQISCGILEENVDLHEDAAFIEEGNFYKGVLMIVLDEHPKGSLIDSPRSSYMYFNKMLKRITAGDVLWFNATKSHAVFPRSQLKYMTVWFHK